MQKILIIGCGDIGKRVARPWIDQGINVFGVIRNIRQADHLRELHINPIIGDLDDSATLTDLPVQDALIYYFAPPPDDGDDDPRMRNFIDSLKDQQPAKIIYISTTGVYGDCRGAWITENSPVNPQTSRGKRRLAAEAMLLEWHDRSNRPIVILRVAGIYGPGRLPVERIKSDQAVLREQEAPYSNRIHSDDLARVCLKAGGHSTSGYHVYNVSDGHPTTMTDYFNRVAANAGLEPPRTISMEEAAHEYSPMMLSFLNESKRVDNRKMLEELGVKLLYPDLETGLKHCRADQ